MLSGLGNSLSAITAFQTKMDTAANNAANISTDGFKASRVVMKAGAGGQGVTASVETVDAPGAKAVEQVGGETRVVERSNVNLAEEMTDMRIAQRGVEANVVALRTADEMLGTLLDIKR